MIGHGALFAAALSTSVAAALYLPPSTASAGCATRPALSQPPARTVAVRPQGVYRHGVGRNHAHDHTSGHQVTNFKRSTRLYKIAMHYNKDLDRDRDGIVCEKL
jgi:hypothetical protein